MFMRNMPRDVFVAVVVSDECSECLPSLGAVALACGVELVRWDSASPHAPDGVVVIAAPGAPQREPALPPGVPSFRIRLSEAAGTSSSVELTSSDVLSTSVRSRKFNTGDPTPALRERTDGVVLAEVDGYPVWTSSRSGSVRHDVNVQAMPWIFGEDRLFTNLSGRYLMRLLPLIEWLRSLSRWAEWKKPPMRACFMFDDPNLHAGRYGFIQFPKLVAEGRRHGYHTSFATVPLDQYYIHEATARLFRENPGELSLLVHGVDHTRRELGAGASSPELMTRLRRGRAWIERLERRGGVRVARVMVPPHGAFAVTALRECAASGYEGACVSWGSVWSSNRSDARTLLLGAEPSTFVEGLPVIPRFRLADGSRNQAFLAAYLAQPIVPVGHQWDLADGTDLLRSLADYINQLGDVRWQSMDAIVRNSYWWRQEGDTLLVLPFSRAFSLPVPEGIQQVRIFRPGATREDVGLTDLRISIASAETRLEVDGSSWNLRVRGPCSVNIGFGPGGGEGPPADRLLRIPPKAMLRRLLAESRDRMMPRLPRRWLDTLRRVGKSGR